MTEPFGFSKVKSVPITPNPLNAELNPICHLLAILGTHHILHFSGIKVSFPRDKENKLFHRPVLSAAGQGGGGTYRKKQSLRDPKRQRQVTNIDASLSTHILSSSPCMHRRCREQEIKVLHNRDKISDEVLPLGCAGKLVGGEPLRTRHQACSPRVRNLNSESRPNAVTAQCAAWSFRGAPSSSHAAPTAACTGLRRITTFRSTTDRIYDGGPKIL